VKCSEDFSDRVCTIITRHTDRMQFVAFMFVSFITFFCYFGSISYHCVYGCMFCVFLFDFVNYVIFLLCIFRFVCSVSLCCSVFLMCVNVYCTAATGCQPNCS
jgi:hypothetical protein